MADLCTGQSTERMKTESYARTVDSIPLCIDAAVEMVGAADSRQFILRLAEQVLSDLEIAVNVDLEELFVY